MNLIDRVKNIIMTPKTEWPKIAGEQPNVGQILMGYVLPLALIPTVASILGWGIFGVGFGSSFTHGIARGLVTLISAFVGVYITAFVIDLLAPTFSSQKNLDRATQLVAYSYTPAWVGGIFNLVPLIGWIGGLFGLYGIYLMYLGIPHVMKTPQEKVIPYMIVSIIVLLVVYALVAAIVGGIMFSLFGISAVTSRVMGM
jgi:hypothetical protein